MGVAEGEAANIVNYPIFARYCLPGRHLSAGDNRALRTRHSMLNSKKNWGYLVNCLKWRIEVLIGLCNLGCISART